MIILFLFICLFIFEHFYEKPRVFDLFKADRSRSHKVQSFQRFLAMKYYSLVYSQFLGWV